MPSGEMIGLLGRSSMNPSSPSPHSSVPRLTPGGGGGRENKKGVNPAKRSASCKSTGVTVTPGKTNMMGGDEEELGEMEENNYYKYNNKKNSNNKNDHNNNPKKDKNNKKITQKNACNGDVVSNSLNIDNSKHKQQQQGVSNKEQGDQKSTYKNEEEYDEDLAQLDMLLHYVNNLSASLEFLNWENNSKYKSS